MPTRSLLALFLGSFVATELAVDARAQCLNWEHAFARRAPDGPVEALASWDDGTGERLYVGGSFGSIGLRPIGYLAAWNGRRWSAVGEALDGPVHALSVQDFGQGPRLVVAGEFTRAGSLVVNRIGVWDGTNWSALGAGFDGRVEALATFDGGAGPELIAGGRFLASGAASIAHIARWNGTDWQRLPGGLAGDVHGLAVVDLGGGPRLYAGGTFTHASAQIVNRIASWNGTTWSPVGGGVDLQVNALAVYSPPGAGAPRLVLGGDFLAAGGVPGTAHVAFFDGSTFTGLGLTSSTTAGGATSFASFDDGAGVRLYFTRRSSSHVWSTDGMSVATRFSLSLSKPQVLATFDDGTGTGLVAGHDGAGGLTEWDGAASQALVEGKGLYGNSTQAQAGLVNLVSVRAPAPRGGLFALGQFVRTPAVPADGGARWDGADWHPIGSGFDFDNVGAEYDDGTGPALWCVGLDPVTGKKAIAKWDGSMWSTLSGEATAITALIGHDDGTGPALYAEGYQWSLPGVVTSGSAVVRWNGSAWSRVDAIPPSSTSPALAFAAFDGGGGPNLWRSTSSGISRWDGTSWIFMASVDAVHALAPYDDGSGPSLIAGGSFSTIGGTPANRIARWNGSSWSTLGAGLSSTVIDVQAWDDGTGPVLYASTTQGVYAWRGGGWSLVPGVPASVLTVHDDGQGSGASLFFGRQFGSPPVDPASGIAALRRCTVSEFCAGDGLDPTQTTACPCSNFGAPGHGCAWSGNPSGARLDATGTTRPIDQLVLSATEMGATGAGVAFLAGTQRLGTAVVFGDGLACLGGTLQRIASKTASSGTATYPEAGELPLSVQSGTIVGSGVLRSYQVVFRNAASFCTPATWNTTNAIEVLW